MKVIDLSQTLQSRMKIYLGDPEVRIEQIHTLEKEGWRLRHISFGSHTGTHVDAFSHMDENGQTLDQIPLERFFGRVKLVKTTDQFPPKIGLVFAEDRLVVDLLAKILAARPPFIVVGDNAELEVELERKLLQNQVVTFTDLVNLDKLPKNKTFMFYGIPLKIKNGDGSPIRAFAVLDD